jgi:hypothetical protein
MTRDHSTPSTPKGGAYYYRGPSNGMILEVCLSDDSAANIRGHSADGEITDHRKQSIEQVRSTRPREYIRLIAAAEQ